MPSNKRGWILAIEDSATDIFLLRHTLDNAAETPTIRQARDGEQAISMIHELAASGDPLPDFILIDLNLPCVDGYEVLAYLRTEEAFHEIPILAVTSSPAEADRKRALAEGADAYFVKPMDIVSYRQLPIAMEDARRVRLNKLAASASSRGD